VMIDSCVKNFVWNAFDLILALVLFCTPLQCSMKKNETSNARQKFQSSGIPGMEGIGMVDDIRPLCSSHSEKNVICKLSVY